MSGSYSRLAAIRDYWMPRDVDARAEVRVTDLDEILRKIEPAQEPAEFDHGIGAARFRVARGAFWWHVLIGDSPAEHGKFPSRAGAEKMAAVLLREFRNGAFAQHEAPPPQSCKQEALASMYIALCDAIGYSARSNELQSPEEWAAQLYAHYAPLRRPLLTGEEIDALALEVRCDPAALRSAIERELRGEKE